jgi:hypothetical protein
MLFVCLLLWKAASVDAGVRWDPAQRIPSPEATSSWFPDLAVDQHGCVHVVWCETDHDAMKRARTPGVPKAFEQLYYSVWDGSTWSSATAISLPQEPIVRNALTADQDDTLHLLLNFSPGPGYDLYYRQAPAAQGLSAGMWRAPDVMNTHWNTYMSDIAAFQHTLHIVYDDFGDREGDCKGCADIFYRRSTDSGRSWAAPLNLRPSESGSSRPQLEVDDSGAVHVTWDEGWDRLSGYGTPQYGVYASSLDGGQTWREPVLVAEPHLTNAQLSAGSTGRGGVMLVWRTTSKEAPGMYYLWSLDWGATWSPPRAIPGILARPWDTPSDIYDLATDAAGHLHLLAVGLPPQAPRLQPPRLYHLEWYGDAWSAPAPVYDGDWYPEYPHLVIDRGNQLHATWFVRADLSSERIAHQVWYAHGQAEALPVTMNVPAAVAAPSERPPYVPPTALGPPPVEGGHRQPGAIHWEQLWVFIACIAAGALIVWLADMIGRLLRRR